MHLRNKKQKKRAIIVCLKNIRDHFSMPKVKGNLCKQLGKTLKFI